MRSKRSMRDSRRVPLAAGALMLVIPGSAVALAAGQADAQSALQINLSSRHIAYGDRLKVAGSTSPSAAGQPVALEFERAGSTSWASVGSTHVGPHGHFQFVTPIKQSGMVRATSTGAPRAVLGSNPGPVAVAPSAARPVQVAPKFRVRTRSIDTLSGRPVSVRGTLLPEVGNRRIVLEGRSGRHWRALTSVRTGSHGGFRLRYRPQGLGHEHLRVRFAGDRRNSRASHDAGQLLVFRESVASWYNDGG